MVSKIRFAIGAFGYPHQTNPTDGRMRTMAESSLAEQTILVTGATDGLGRALTAELAGAGATVLVHGRDDRRGAETVDEIRTRTGNERLHWYRADLASLDEVRRLADRVSSDHKRLDVLVNNAGIGTTSDGDSGRQVSRDGYELRFAVNYLSGYLLTRLLLPLLEAAAPARVVNVASAGQAPLDFDDVMLDRGYDGARAYGQSKLAQIMFTFELAEEYRNRGVTVTCLHPATYMETKMVRAAGIEPVSSVEQGVRATFRLVADPELEQTTGRYFNGVREAEPNAQARDPEARRRLRELSDRLTGIGAPASR
jgi:NAD(P)-dependent dehydrogenase (short-subunit alcohol dehydrogenase family)